MRTQILVVLELEETSKAVFACLTKLDYIVTTCSDFATAKAFLNIRRFDVIISDVHPENGGSVFDFLRWVKDETIQSETPFVMLSIRPTKLAKYLEDGVRTSARVLGCSMYISMESFDPLMFGEQIKSLLPPAEELAFTN